MLQIKTMLQKTRIWLSGALLMLGLLPGLAGAHGTIPAGDVPFFENGALIGGAMTYGIVMIDQDEVPRWSAEETLVSDTDAGIARWYWRRSDGRIFVGTFRGLFFSDDAGCSWTHDGGALVDHHLAAFGEDRDTPGRLFVATSSGQDPVTQLPRVNTVYRSTDAGVTWTDVGPSGAGYLYKQVLPSPVGDLVVARAVDLDTQSILLWTSTDGGDTWNAAGLDPNGWTSLRFLGFSQDGQTLYLAGRSAADSLDRLLTSADGLASLTEVTTFTDPDVELTAFAEDAAGHRVIVQDLERTWRDAGDGNFVEETGGPSRCLGLEGGVVWGCGQLRDGFHYLEDTAEGWVGHISIADVMPRDCPAGTPGATHNPELWPAVQSQGVGPRPSEGDRGTGDGGAGGAGGGCACSPTDRGGSPWVDLSLLLGVTLGLALRRRRS